MRGEFGGAGAQGDEPDAALGQLSELGLGGHFGVHHQQRRIGAGHRLPVVGEGEDLVVLAGFGQVGVGVEQGVGVGVFGEEGQHAAGALRACGHVVLFQGGVLAPVHDRVEVQVEHLAGGQARGDARLVQGGEEGALFGVLEPVGVGGQRGGLG